MVPSPCQVVIDGARARIDVQNAEAQEAGWTQPAVQAGAWQIESLNAGFAVGASTGARTTECDVRCTGRIRPPGALRAPHPV